MIGRDFLYDKIWLSQFGMRMYTPEDAQRFPSREIIKSEISPTKSEPVHYSTRYSDVLVLHFLILKDDESCENQSDYYIKEDELHALRTWLEGTNKPKELYLKDKNNHNNTYYNGIFTDIQPYLLNDECYGLYLTFTCNAPYGFSPVYTKTINSNGEDGNFNTIFYNQSSERQKMLYPIITVNSSSVFSGKEQISIVNSDTQNNKPLEIKLPKNKVSIVIDCEKKMIYDENNLLIPLKNVGIQFTSDEDGFLSAESTKIYWIKLKSRENNIGVSLVNCNTVDNVQISARFPTKSGGF